MSIFDCFRRYNTRRQRQAQIAVNCSMAELNRKALGIKREAEKSKAEAIRLEQSGEHQSAVAAALAAEQLENSYKAAKSTIQKCKNMHAQVKSQKAMEELLKNCSEIVRGVCADADPLHYLKIQSDFEQARDDLREASENMAAAQEGFATDVDAQIRNEAGEAALARIQAEQLPSATAPAKAEPAAARPVPERASTDDQHRAWADDRRRLLAEMI